MQPALAAETATAMRVWRDGKRPRDHSLQEVMESVRFEEELFRQKQQEQLGTVATAEEAEAQRAAAALTAQEVRKQAQAEGLTLRRASANQTGFYGVHHVMAGRNNALPAGWSGPIGLTSIDHPGQSYHAKVLRGGEKVHLGIFATPEEAALCVARSPEGRAAAATAHGSRAWSWDARKTIKALALDIIYEAAGAATAELSAEVAAEVMAGIAMGL